MRTLRVHASAEVVRSLSLPTDEVIPSRCTCLQFYRVARNKPDAAIRGWVDPAPQMASLMKSSSTESCFRCTKRQRIQKQTENHINYLTAFTTGYALNRYAHQSRSSNTAVASSEHIFKTWNGPWEARVVLDFIAEVVEGATHVIRDFGLLQ